MQQGTALAVWPGQLLQQLLFDCLRPVIGSSSAPHCQLFACRSWLVGPWSWVAPVRVAPALQHIVGATRISSRVAIADSRLRLQAVARGPTNSRDIRGFAAHSLYRVQKLSGPFGPDGLGKTLAFGLSLPGAMLHIRRKRERTN